MGNKREMSKLNKMVVVALFAALTAIGAFARIQVFTIPFTLQFLFCALSGVLLGSKLGFRSQLLYVLVGLAGFPVFTKGGGLGYVFNITFGYLLGFIVAGYVTGKYMEIAKKENFKNVLIASLLGISVVYIIGVPYYYLAQKYFLGQPLPWKVIVAYGFTSSILGDLLLCVLIALVSPKILRSLRKAGYDYKS